VKPKKELIMSGRIFYPTSSKGIEPVLGRHGFGDKRLDARHKKLLSELSENQSSVIYQLGDGRKSQAGAYRFLNNDKVSLSELIDRTCAWDMPQCEDRDLLVAIDSTSVKIKIGSKDRYDMGKSLGVLEDNRTPGFFLVPSLLMDRNTHQTLGIGDILHYTRPLIEGNTQQKQQDRAQRRKLALQDKEAGMWSIVAQNTAKRLQQARSLTFVMDQGADKYESLQQILESTKQDFIVRVKEDRQAVSPTHQTRGRFSQLLDNQCWMDVRRVPIRALNHYSKSSGKRVQRKARKALLAIRYVALTLERPSSYSKYKALLKKPLYLVEVLEHPSTIPPGEPPIHWRLLTTWALDELQMAWQVVRAYQARWNVEQLFRILKKQGFDVENSQLQKPKSIKKLTVMALKASEQALRLSTARNSQDFTPIECMFDQTQQQLLIKLNAKLSGQTPKITNPHADNSLAWAAWIIARLGGWSGYKSQRPPGPITMSRGLIQFYAFCDFYNLIDGT